MRRRIGIWVTLLALGGALTTASAQDQKKEFAVFAGGCFWCVEAAFDGVEGVTATTSGYTGGSAKDAHYEVVSAGGTGHFESLRVEYDPRNVGYEKLLDVFWHNIDPFDGQGQFCDKGSQYRSAIFPQTEEQRSLAEASLKAIERKLGRKVQTLILPATPFYPAEEYHQDYYLKNPIRYKFYRWNCGRDQRLSQVWGDDAGGH